MLAVIDYGSLPEWLAGVGALLALLFAAIAAKAAVAASRSQDLQVRAPQEDRRRLQAGRVVAWRTRSAESPTDEFSLIVRNSSDLPVFQICIAAYPHLLTEDGRLVEYVAQLPDYFVKWEADVLPPGDVLVKVAPDEVPIHYHQLRFCDVTGRTWTRALDNGQLMLDEPLASDRRTDNEHTYRAPIIERLRWEILKERKKYGRRGRLARAIRNIRKQNKDFRRSRLWPQS